MDSLDDLIDKLIPHSLCVIKGCYGIAKQDTLGIFRPLCGAHHELWLWTTYHKFDDFAEWAAKEIVNES